MTVCIAILCDSGKQIVSVSDHMLSMEHFTGDGLALKTEWIHRSWFAMCAGDVSYVPAILSCVGKMLKGNEEYEWLEVAAAFQNGYKAVINSEINGSILAKHGYDINTFYKRGKTELTASAFNAIHRAIKEFKLNADFLVCGFDANGDGHIFTFEDGATKSCDKVGMWAIGSGSMSALSTLFFAAKEYNFNANKPVHVAIYASLAAKFMSESAEGVGKQTFLTIDKFHHRGGYVNGEFVHKFRDKWFKEYSLRWPTSAMDELLANYKAGEAVKLPQGKAAGE